MLFSSVLPAQVLIGAGSGVEVGETVIPSAWFQGAGSFYTFPSQALSLFLDVAGRGGWEQEDASELFGVASLQGTASYRVGGLTSRLALSTYAQGATDDNPLYFRLANEALITYGTFQYSFFVEPSYIFAHYDDSTHQLEGRVGGSVTVLDTTVMTAGVDGFVSLEEPNVTKSGWGGSLEGSWYPAIPVSADAAVRLTKAWSDDSLQFGDEELFLDNYLQYEWDVSVLTNIGSSMSVDLLFAGWMREKEHPAIVDGVLQQEDEWQLRLSPGLSHSFRFTRYVSLVTELSVELRRSNSSYGALNNETFGLSSTARYRFP
jgi:hypothetical protein